MFSASDRDVIKTREYGGKSEAFRGRTTCHEQKMIMRRTTNTTEQNNVAGGFFMCSNLKSEDVIYIIKKWS